MLDCDVLLMLGTDFPCRQFYPREAGYGSHSSIRLEQIDGHAPVDLGVVGDIKFGAVGQIAIRFLLQLD